MGNVPFYSCLHVILVMACLVAEALTNTASVMLQCKNCGVTGQNIVAGSGNDITLTYFIKMDDFSNFHVYLEYDGSKFEVVSIDINGAVTSKQPSTDINLKFTQNETIVNGSWYVFGFSITNISESVHKGKSFSYVFNPMGGEQEVGKHTFDVLFGPNDLQGFKKKYVATEKTTLDISIAVAGNPKPNISVYLDSGRKVSCPLQYFEHKSYNCSASLKDITRKFCNRTLNLKATGYKPITQGANMLVNFIPEPPQITNATITGRKANIVWTPIEAGNCRVRYLLFYTDTIQRYNISTEEMSLSTSLDLFDYTASFDVNVTFVVRAQVVFNNYTSIDSEPKTVRYSYHKPDKEKVKSKVWIAGIVVGVLVLLVGIIVIIKRKQVHQFCLNKIGNNQ